MGTGPMSESEISREIRAVIQLSSTAHSISGTSHIVLVRYFSSGSTLDVFIGISASVVQTIAPEREKRTRERAERCNMSSGQRHKLFLT